ncbi:4Fe-4S iron sulfur cluster binding s, NifH/frxC family protein [Gammaproteobacteria bacterium]
MAKQYWSSSDIRKLFRMNERISKQTLLNAEARGEIPKAERVARGSVSARQWKIHQLPEIGKIFGFLKPPKKQKVICVYIPKGGVFKTTLSYNLGRILALNGIKTIFVGVDHQRSLTKYAIPSTQINSLEELSKMQQIGLYHYFFEKVPLIEIIQHTDLPTLDVLPETSNLNFFAQRLTPETRREYFFKDKLIPNLENYQVIIFDNNPGWTELVKNSLVASNVLLAPIGCEAEAYSAVTEHLNTIDEFKNTVKASWDCYLIPTNLKKDSLSQTFYGKYLELYRDKIISSPIRNTVKGQEARILECSIFEYDPSCPLAQDYYDLIIELWNKIGN